MNNATEMVVGGAKKTEAAAIRAAKKFPGARIEHVPASRFYAECWYVIVPRT